MNQNTYKQVTQSGIDGIRLFLAARHVKGADITDEQICVWAANAELNASSFGAASLEIPAWDSVSGHVEVCELSDAGTGEVEIDECA